MIRKYIEKYCSIIQWTKKWHFFHLFFILLYAILVFLPYNIFQDTLKIILLYPLLPFKLFFPNMPVAADDIYAIILVFFIAGLIPIIFAITFEFAILIIKAILRKPFSIQNKFFLHNKFYNVIYFIFTSLFFLGILEFIVVFIVFNIIGSLFEAIMGF